MLKEFGSLSRYATWFLEHGNKWLKSNIQAHSNHGGGTAAPETSVCKQALERMLHLTHPEVRSNARQLNARRRSLYICRGCNQLKLEGHTARCTAAKNLKAQDAVLASIRRS